MDERNQRYFEAMERLFSTADWQVLADDIKGWQDAISTQWRSLKPETLAYEQGRFAGLEQVLKHSELCESLKAKELQDALENDAL